MYSIQSYMYFNSLRVFVMFCCSRKVKWSFVMNYMYFVWNYMYFDSTKGAAMTSLAFFLSTVSFLELAGKQGSLRSDGQFASSFLFLNPLIG